MRNIVLLGLVSLLTDVSTEMVYPLLPLFLTETLRAGPAVLGLVEGVAESVAALMKVGSGYWSDRLGRRKPLAAAGYALGALGKLFLFVAASWGWVLTGRVVDRFGKGVRTAPRDALVADSVPREQLGRAFGLHRAMDTLGASLGVLGAYLFVRHSGGDLRAAFLWAFLPGALALLFFLPLRERRGGPGGPPSTTPAPPAVPALRPAAAWAALTPALKAFLLLAFLFSLGNSSNQFLLLRAGSLGADAGTVVLLYLTYNLVYTAAAYPAGRLGDRLGHGRVLVWGHLAYALVYAAFAAVTGGPALWAVFAAYGIYSAFTEGVARAFLAELAPPGLRATVLGLHATLVGLALLPASLLAGALWEAFGAPAPFWFGAGTGLLAAAGLARLVKRHPADAEADHQMPQEDPLSRLDGRCPEPGKEDAARNHDDYLYRGNGE